MLSLLWIGDNRLCLGFLQKRQAWEEGLVEACCMCGFISACNADCHVSSDQVGSQAFLQSGGSMLKEMGKLKTS